MRSVTSRPAFLRASCTSRTTSRTSPASRSSCVSSRSSATVSEPADATAHPERGVSAMTTSSPLIGSVSPSTSTVAVAGPVGRHERRPGRRPGWRGRRAACACRSGARARGSWACTDSSTSSPVSLRLASATTLSSSRTCALRSSGSDDQPGAEIRAWPSGWRVFIFESARAERPSSTSRRTSATCSDSSASTSASSASGHDGEVHRVGPAGGREQRPPHLLGDERGERRQQPGQHVEALVQRRQRGRVAVPEPPPRAAHVPVRQVVDAARRGPCRPGRCRSSPARRRPRPRPGAPPTAPTGRAWCAR